MPRPYHCFGARRAPSQDALNSRTHPHETPRDRPSPRSSCQINQNASHWGHRVASRRSKQLVQGSLLAKKETHQCKVSANTTHTSGQSNFTSAVTCSMQVSMTRGRQGECGGRCLLACVGQAARSNGHTSGMGASCLLLPFRQKQRHLHLFPAVTG